MIILLCINQPDEPNPDASPSKRVSAMVLTNNHTLWIGNYEGELKFYDLKPEVIVAI